MARLLSSVTADEAQLQDRIQGSLKCEEQSRLDR
jgi:hypothetical protein